MLQNIINSLIEGIGSMLIVAGIPTGIILLFVKWVYKNDNQGGSNK